VYYNSITCSSTTTRPSPLCGGILADDMGLGKTIQCIALALKRPHPNNPREPHQGGTLVVCPTSVLSNWSEQIEAHVFPDNVTVGLFHGSNRSYVFCSMLFLPSFLVHDGVFVSLIHLLLPSCIL
jgi:hypothetical protein